jgi:D-3-phosphoglycerate dehydrogenase / 2-oxoglutarate reductase
MAERKTVFVPSNFLHPDGATVFEPYPEIEIVYALTEQERQDMRRSPELRRKLQARSNEVLDAHLPRIHALFAMGLMGHLPVTAEMISRAKSLEVIFIPAAGTDRIDVGAATEHGVVVVNAPNGNANSVAEHSVGLMLGLCRRIVERDRAIHSEKRMDMMAVMQRGTPLSNLNGKTLGIVGYGFVGRTLADMCRRAFAMKVISFDPFFDPIEAERQGTTMLEDLNDLLAQADFVSINTPLLESTRGMIGKEQLAKMKKTAFLINTGRGPIVDTEALVAALRDRVIAGAGLDVTDPEPLPDGHPLFDLDNVVITPHLGGNSPETFRPCSVIASRLALDVLRGKRPSNMINPAAWDRLRARLSKQAAKN